jgi:hypothetical protein
MKKSGFRLFLVVGSLFCLSAFALIKTGSIQGKLMPADGAIEVLAINGADTLRVSSVNGSFVFKNIKTGTYTVVAKAKPPYQDIVVKDVAVIDSVTTDVGILKFQQ